MLPCLYSKMSTAALHKFKTKWRHMAERAGGPGIKMPLDQRTKDPTLHQILSVLHWKEQ